MRPFKLSLLLSLLITFSLTACTPEKERDQKDGKDTSIQEEVDASNTDVELDIEEPDTSPADVEQDTSPQDAEEDTSPQDVEQDIEEQDAEEEVDVPDIVIPRAPCTISDIDNQIEVDCPDGTNAKFNASLINIESNNCEQISNGDDLDTITCSTNQRTDDIINSTVTITSPLEIASLAYATDIKVSLIINAPGLISFTFQSLEQVHSKLLIDTQVNLENFSFPKLHAVGDFLLIKGNAKLSDLNGLETLTTVGASFDIHDNPLITDLTGLENLKSVAGNLTLTRNAKLRSPQGLDTLHTIGLYLGLNSNPELINLDGLDALSELGGRLHVENNIKLCQTIVTAWIAAFKETTGWANTINTGGNKTDCN